MAIKLLNMSFFFTYRHFSNLNVCVCSPVFIIYFQTPEAALASCGRAYLMIDGQVKPSSTLSYGELVSDLLEYNLTVKSSNLGKYNIITKFLTNLNIRNLKY